MRSADPPGRHEETPLPASPRETGALTQPSPAEEFPAWEQIEAGRYMPRRTRGSFPGRELG